MDGASDAWDSFTQSSGMNANAYTVGANTFLDTFKAMRTTFNEFAYDFVTGNKKAGEAAKDFAKNLLSSMAQIATNQLALSLFKMVGNVALNLLAPGSGAGAGAELPVSSTTTPFVVGQNGMNYEGGLIRARPFYEGGYLRFNRGGRVPGVHLGRDSVPAYLAPGEGVLNRRAMHTIGEDMLNALNRGQAVVDANKEVIRKRFYDGGSASLSGSAASMVSLGEFDSTVSNIATKTPSMPKKKPDEVNVYVVSPEQRPSLGPKDVLMVISEDIATGGTTKKLIKQVMVGA